MVGKLLPSNITEFIHVLGIIIGINTCLLTNHALFRYNIKAVINWFSLIGHYIGYYITAMCTKSVSYTFLETGCRVKLAAIGIIAKQLHVNASIACNTFIFARKELHNIIIDAKMLVLT